MGGFLLTVGTSFGYAAGWTPYAADYTRYLPSTVSTARTGLFASAGLFLSCVVLEVVGAASVTIGGASLGNPTEVVHQRAGLAAGQGHAAGHRHRRHRRQLHQCLFRRNGFRDHRRQAARPHRPGAGHGVLRRGRVPGRVVGAARRRAQLRGVPADHRLLDRAVAGCGVRRPVPAARSAVAGFLYDRVVCELEWPAVVRHRTGGVGAAVLQSGRSSSAWWPRHCPQLGDITFFVGFVLAGGAYLVLCRSKIDAERTAV